MGDQDPEWKEISSEITDNLDLKVEDDGEFYMSLSDFLAYYGKIEICYLKPKHLLDTLEGFSKIHSYGEWIDGVSAGGLSDEEIFATNPQFFINLQCNDVNNNSGECKILISLMQSRKSRKIKDHAIGIKIFQLCSNGRYQYVSNKHNLTTISSQNVLDTHFDLLDTIGSLILANLFKGRIFMNISRV